MNGEDNSLMLIPREASEEQLSLFRSIEMRPRMEVLPPEPPPVKESSNLPSLREVKEEMLKGYIFLESALFSQAGYESGRLQRTRTTVHELEKKFLNLDEIKKLSPELQYDLYHLLTKNMGKTVDFFQKLHLSMGESLNHLTQMERLEKDFEKPKEEAVEDKMAREELRVMLFTEIKKRIKERSK